MKWAKVKEKSPGTNSKDKDAEQNKKNDAICFDEYPDIGTLKSELEQKKKIWEHFEFKYNFPEPVNENYKKFQERYEMFCGGYLLFYDEVVRNRVVDHTIHFKWSLEKGTGKYSVTIYISPEPQTTIKNYVKKSGKGYNEFYKEKLLVPQDMTTANGGVDPPPPPPPPPPPMHY